MIFLGQSSYTLPATTSTTLSSPMNANAAPMSMSMESGFGAIGHVVGGAAARRFHAGTVSGTGAGAPPHPPSHHATSTLGPRHGLGFGQGSPPMIGGLGEVEGAVGNMRNGSGVNLGSRTGDWR